MPDCVFCKIVQGLISAQIIYRADCGVALLDIHPVAPGHTLWVPKQHYGSLDEMDDGALSVFLPELSRLGKTIRDVTNSGGYNVLLNHGKVAGQEVAHVHFHIIPRREGDGLGYRWRVEEYHPGQAETLQERLHRVLMTHA